MFQMCHKNYFWLSGACLFLFFSPPHGPQKVRNDVLLLEQIDEAAGMCFQPSYINGSVL